MTSTNPSPELFVDERSFVEFRRKVRSAEMLSAAMERLLRALRCTGKLSVLVQNGRVLLSGYEEGHFTQREPDPSRSPSKPGPPRHESRASLLLERCELAPQGGAITEVPEVTPAVAPAHEAPVEL
jgi:hypothetical protein